MAAAGREAHGADVAPCFHLADSLVERIARVEAEVLLGVLTVELIRCLPLYELFSVGLPERRVEREHLKIDGVVSGFLDVYEGLRQCSDREVRARVSQFVGVAEHAPIGVGSGCNLFHPAQKFVPGHRRRWMAEDLCAGRVRHHYGFIRALAVDHQHVAALPLEVAHGPANYIRLVIRADDGQDFHSFILSAQ